MTLTLWFHLGLVHLQYCNLHLHFVKVTIKYRINNMELNYYTCICLFLIFLSTLCECIDPFISQFLKLCFVFIYLLSLSPCIFHFILTCIYLYLYFNLHIWPFWVFFIIFFVNASCLVLHTLEWSHYLPSHQLHCNSFSASLMSLVRITGRENKITKQMILCVYCYESHRLLPAIECVISTNFTVIFE